MVRHVLHAFAQTQISRPSLTLSRYSAPVVIRRTRGRPHSASLANSAAGRDAASRTDSKFSDSTERRRSLLRLRVDTDMSTSYDAHRSSKAASTWRERPHWLSRREAATSGGRRMRNFARIVGLLIGVVLMPAVAHAQGAIAGQVKDPSGAVLPGVTVEAASPVLIEKTRSVVTDGSGNYRIEDLRPGTYSVTFTLTGFSTVRRDEVLVSGSAVTSIDSTLRVGAVSETITVTGESPIVDTTNTRKQVVLDHDAVQNLPSSRQYFTLARMAAGTSGGGADVGGSAGIADVGQSLTAHGSKAVDQRVMLNGVSIMTLQAGGNIGGQQPDVGSAAEIAIDSASLSAEGPTGGVRINFIPKDGGNTFGNSTFVTFANESMQGSNYTDDLKARGLATPTKIDNTWDLNESVGGPIKKDKAWFWFSTRFNRANAFAGVFKNKNAFNPNAWTYVPDPSAPAENHGEVQQNNLRITWQAAPKIKVAFEQKVDSFCNCPYQAGAIAATNNGVFNSLQAAPESARDRRFPRLRQEHVEFTS